MACKTCQNNRCKIVGDKGMECKICNNKQFHTKRQNHKPVALVCSKCKAEKPIKEKKPDKKIFKKESDQ